MAFLRVRLLGSQPKLDLSLSNPERPRYKGYVSEQPDKTCFNAAIQLLPLIHLDIYIISKSANISTEETSKIKLCLSLNARSISRFASFRFNSSVYRIFFPFANASSTLA